MTNQLASRARIDFRPGYDRPRLGRVIAAMVAAIIVSLVVDALLVVIAQAAFPSTKGYAHFQVHQYATLTVLGIIVASVAWLVVNRVSSDPHWLFLRLAVLVTVVLWLPDVYLLTQGQPGDAVAFLFLMHLAIALITYNLLVRLAPIGPARGPLPRQSGRSAAEVG